MIPIPTICEIVIFSLKNMTESTTTTAENDATITPTSEAFPLFNASLKQITPTTQRIPRINIMKNMGKESARRSLRANGIYILKSNERKIIPQSVAV